MNQHNKACIIDHQTYKIGVHGLAYVWGRGSQEWLRTLKKKEEIESALGIRPEKVKSEVKLKTKKPVDVVKSYLDKHPEPTEYDEN